MQSKIKQIIISPFKAIYRFFCWSSGAYLDILDLAPTDKNKYFGMGGTIVFTALMASLSGGYAFFTTFKSATLAVLFGVFWGFLIFNLDRFIVNTMYSDGTHAITRKEFMTGLPRIIIAIFLGIVISLPLEIKVFEKEVDFEINNIKEKKRQEYLSNSNIDSEIKQLKLDISTLDGNLKDVASGKTTPLIVKNRIQKLNQEIEELKTKIHQATDYIGYQLILIKRINEKAGSENRELTINENNSIRNANTIIRNTSSSRSDLTDQMSSKESERDKLESGELTSTQEAMASMSNEINLKREQLHKKEEEKKKLDEYIKRELGKYEGFMAKMEAFSLLRSKHRVIDLAAYFIMFLIIIIEITPTLFKMMQEKGPYDDILNRIRHEIKVNQLLLQSNINHEINTAVKIHSEKTAIKLNAELLANKELIESIAKSQAEIAQVAIEEWKKEQITKVKGNPFQFIKSDDKVG